MSSRLFFILHIYFCSLIFVFAFEKKSLNVRRERKRLRIRSWITLVFLSYSFTKEISYSLIKHRELTAKCEKSLIFYIFRIFFCKNKSFTQTFSHIIHPWTTINKMMMIWMIVMAFCECGKFSLEFAEFAEFEFIKKCEGN